MANLILTLKDTSEQTKYFKTFVKFDKSFNTRLSKTFEISNDKLASFIIQRADAYVPVDTGALRASPKKRKTESGVQIVYDIPYATYAYSQRNSRKGVIGKRGPRWIDRMWADYKNSILRDVYKTVGKGL